MHSFISNSNAVCLYLHIAFVQAAALLPEKTSHRYTSLMMMFFHCSTNIYRAQHGKYIGLQECNQ